MIRILGNGTFTGRYEVDFLWVCLYLSARETRFRTHWHGKKNEMKWNKPLMGPTTVIIIKMPFTHSKSKHFTLINITSSRKFIGYLERFECFLYIIFRSFQFLCLLLMVKENQVTFVVNGLIGCWSQNSRGWTSCNTHNARYLKNNCGQKKSTWMVLNGGTQENQPTKPVLNCSRSENHTHTRKKNRINGKEMKFFQNCSKRDQFSISVSNISIEVERGREDLNDLDWTRSSKRFWTTWCVCAVWARVGVLCSKSILLQLVFIPNWPLDEWEKWTTNH